MGNANDTMELTALLVSAYLRSNALSTHELTELIRSAYSGIENASSVQPQAPEQLLPAISVRKSIAPHAITCLECGKQQKTLKRHLGSAHGLSVDEYRSKWNLPADYPMVAPEYAQHRSRLAMQIGLGRKPKDAPAPVITEAKPVVAKAKPVVAEVPVVDEVPVAPEVKRPILKKVAAEKPVPKEEIKVDSLQDDAGKPQHHYPASRWSKPSN